MSDVLEDMAERLIAVEKERDESLARMQAAEMQAAVIRKALVGLLEQVEQAKGGLVQAVDEAKSALRSGSGVLALEVVKAAEEVRLKHKEVPVSAHDAFWFAFDRMEAALAELRKAGVRL